MNQPLSEDRPGLVPRLTIPAQPEDGSHPEPAGWNFDNSYVHLPRLLYVRQKPVPVRAPRIVAFNRSLASLLGLDAEALAGDEGAAVFSGNRIPHGACPMAQAYAGHQFGHFTMLGDGRAILLGEHITPRGERFDIQLKGSGQTPFSRRGDGRAALGPMLREYLISEAMSALGIPTSRSLAVATTGEPVFRETELAGAILTRVASSHIRVGTFEFLAHRGSRDDLRALAAHTLHRHYRDLQGAANPHIALLHAVMERQASLVARWMHVGFIHGVMNTDNMTLCGESIDYGPCAFMDAYHPATVFSAIDRGGRYAYANQPSMARWNLARLAETLLPLLDDDPEKALGMAQEALASWPERFERHWLCGMRAKLGLFTEEMGDGPLIDALLALMSHDGLDYTNTFRDLASGIQSATATCKSDPLSQWRERWKDRLARQPDVPGAARGLMLTHNPAVIPRNHLVEAALSAAVEGGDYAPMERLLNILGRPYEDAPENAGYRSPPAHSERVYRTFCGT